MKWVCVFRCRLCKGTFEESVTNFDKSLLSRPDHPLPRFHECSPLGGDGMGPTLQRHGIGDFVGVRELGRNEVGVAESPEVRAIADALSGGPTRDAAPKAPTSCSFCGKHLKEVAKLIVGAWVCICNECVGLCVDIIAKEVAEKGQG